MAGEGAPTRVRREAAAPASEPFGMGALAAALEPALKAAAGEDAACVSVSLAFARPPAPGAVLQVEAWVERATRTLVFVAAEATADGEPAGAASAIFSRPSAR